MARAVEDHGRLDILVNNAGTTEVIAHPDLDAASPEVWRRIFDVNVIGTWQVTVAAVPHLRAGGDGAVVNVSSVAGHTTRGSSIPYATSKAAVSHMTELLANVLGPEIRVNAVAPGLVDTPWTADWDVVREFVRAQAPLQRSGTPEDIAARDPRPGGRPLRDRRDRHGRRRAPPALTVPGAAVAQAPAPLP